MDITTTQKSTLEFDHHLSQDQWEVKMKTHQDRVDELLEDYLDKRQHHIKNPVVDFLFEYYQFRPSHLARWSPGFGVFMKGDDIENVLQINELRQTPEGAYVDPDALPKNRYSSLQWILALLESTSGRNPSLGCYGMHEWAMVYKTDRIRHDYVPLRFSKEEIARVVESQPVVCTHFDAFRFFSEKARPLNKYKPSREKFIDMEQPGCLHTNMDLYKWAFKMYPWISSDLILKAFELALETRKIDMKASPYDLRDYGYEPIKIETEKGREEYRKLQKEIWQKSIPIREKLLTSYRKLADYLEI